MTAPVVQAMKVAEPIEIRLSRRGNSTLVLLAANVNGVIRYGLSALGSGVPQSLSNLQSPAVWPAKAVDGWQAEVLAAATAGLYPVEEVR